MCKIANELFPKGYVCSGHAAPLETLRQKAMKAKALQAKAPKTSGAFHTELMEPANKKLIEALNTTTINFPEVAVRHCLCLVFPLPSWLRQCLSLWFSGVQQRHRQGLHLSGRDPVGARPAVGECGWNTAHRAVLFCRPTAVFLSC